jgi:hypothetical protein
MIIITTDMNDSVMKRGKQLFSADSGVSAAALKRLVAAAFAAGLLALSAELVAQGVGTPPANPVSIYGPPARSAGHPRSAAFSGSRLIDIPQWAKAEGHNGWATWVAKVGVDGKPLSLTLKRSSGSFAIDTAAKTRVENGYFLPAVGLSGEVVEAEMEIDFNYSKWNADGKGGALNSYTCADLVREFDWFSHANAKTGLLFLLQNYFTSLDGIAAMVNGETPSQREILTSRRKREKCGRS